MSIRTVKGNLITLAKEGQFNVIVHGANCFNAMGGGIAAEVHRRLFNAHDIDFFFTKKGSKNKLGKITYAVEETLQHTPFVVINAYTQYHPGANFKLKALVKCLKKIRKQFGGMNLRFGFPLIGAGIGGGNWEDILNEIQWYLGDEDVMIVEFDGSK